MPTRPPQTPAALLAALVLLASGCGDGGAPEDGATTPTEATSGVAGGSVEAGPSRGEAGAGPGGGRHEPAADGGGGRRGESTPDPQPSAARKRAAAGGAERAYSAYIEAINERDGRALCDLLPPNAERLLRPPVEAGSCARRIGGSIGYRDPRGYPVWERTELSGIESASVGADPSTARLTASIVTEFADRSEPSVESDIAYLERVGDRWRLAQPSAAIYRAIGRPELPPSVIAPP